MLIDALQRPQRTVRLRLAVALVVGSALALALLARVAGAQGHVHAAEAPSPAASPASPHARDNNARFHMEMSPVVAGTAADTVRAARVAAALREALGKYRDTTAAVADGYKMFLPRVKEQKVYHFTSGWRAMQEAFRFDPEKPTSLLYRKDSTGRFVLIGAMYTAPKRFGYDKLDARVPLSVARWHRHVNWCLPKRGETRRWGERQNGEPVFGPESPIATKEACEAAGGRFHESLFGWMLHANVFGGDDPAAVWGDEHAGHDPTAMMGTGHSM